MNHDIVQLLPEIELISDRDLREKVITVWQQAFAMANWQDPHAIPFNAAIGNEPSLIDHTRSVTKTALGYAQNYEDTFGGSVDHDLLLAGALLHDVSKAIEFEPGAEKPEKSAIGINLPHGTFSTILAWQAELPLPVLHLIATHSPAAPMLPNTIEGYILKYADLLDADAHYCAAGLPTIMERFKK